MLRILIVAVISLASFFPLYEFTTNGCGLDENWGAIVAMIAAVICVPSVLLNVWKGKPSPEVMPIDINDPIMQKLIEKSRSEISRLIQGVDGEEMEAFVKFPYKFGDEVEHVWGIVHYIKAGYALVSLESSPIGEVPESAAGRLKISLAEMEDWMLVDKDGKTYGGYSILGLAEIYTREYGKLPKAYALDLERFVDFEWPEND